MVVDIYSYDFGQPLQFGQAELDLIPVRPQVQYMSSEFQPIHSLQASAPDAATRKRVLFKRVGAVICKHFPQVTVSGMGLPEGPLQQIIEAVLRMACDDAGDHVRKLGLGLDADELAGGN